MTNTVHIIGAGVGGLSMGALLTHSGNQVNIYEKSNKTGGRTTSMTFRNHILDNGFHIMPFYKKSSIYEVLQKVGIASRLKLAKVDDISFHSDTGFHRYPKGMVDLLQLSLIPFKSRINLLKVLLPMAFASIEKTESWDDKSLTEVTKKLDNETGAFFEAVCMLAFADTADHISLGEFATNYHKSQSVSKEELVNLHILMMVVMILYLELLAEYIIEQSTATINNKSNCKKNCY